MENQTSNEQAKAESEAQEIFRSWLEQLELFFKDDSGKAILKEYGRDEASVVRLVFLAQVQAPKGASPELQEVIRELRAEKMETARSQLQAIYFVKDLDERDLDRRLKYLEAMARGNASTIRRASMTFSVVPRPAAEKADALNPVRQSSASPVRVSSSSVVATATSRPTPPIMGLPTMPCKASDLKGADIQSFFSSRAGAPDTPADDTPLIEVTESEEDDIPDSDG